MAETKASQWDAECDCRKQRELSDSNGIVRCPYYGAFAVSFGRHGRFEGNTPRRTMIMMEIESSNDIIQRLEDPSRIADLAHREVLLSLQDRARKRVGDTILDSVDHPERLLYTQYHDFGSERERAPRYALVSETPGALTERHEIKALDNATTTTERIYVYQQYYASWLVEKRRRFVREFFSTLCEAGFLDEDRNWMKYVETRAIFEDFLVTDLVKYRVDGGELRVTDRTHSFREVLRPEFETIDPEITFVLGGKAWDGFVREANPVPIDDLSPQPDDWAKIKQVHGYAFQTDIGVIIPLVHPSDGAQIRDSYTRYLKEGLETVEAAELSYTD